VGVPPQVILVVKGIVVLAVSILQSERFKSMIGAGMAGRKRPVR
jgi:hypothetical protein